MLIQIKEENKLQISKSLILNFLHSHRNNIFTDIVFHLLNLNNLEYDNIPIHNQ